MMWHDIRRIVAQELAYLAFRAWPKKKKSKMVNAAFVSLFAAMHDGEMNDGC